MVPVRSVRLFEIDDCGIEAVLRAKGTSTVSLCIPCRDEAATIGSLVSIIRAELMRKVPFVDNDRGRRPPDDSAVAASAGAKVVSINDVRCGGGHGRQCVGSLCQYGRFRRVDRRHHRFEPHWITRLLAPMLDDESVALVKAVFHRPTQLGGGGRTTELVARPLFSLYYPELASLHQPLAGEYAGRRAVLEQLPFVQGWGVEVAMLIDIARRYGPEAIAQIDLGTREHRHRGLHSLSVQAAEVMATLLARVPEGSLLHVGACAAPRRSVVPLNSAEPWPGSR
jgi:glucosyl-3-phosphoglycerate synthase